MAKLKIYGGADSSKLKYNTFQVPVYKNKPKYGKLKNFLVNQIEGYRDWLTCDENSINALLVENKEVMIDTQKCIGCLLCLASQREVHELALRPLEAIEEILPNASETKKWVSVGIFHGTFVKFPTFAEPRYLLKSFQDFTKTNETKHIALWGTAILRFLSSSANARIGKEIEVMQTESPRDGRLDICLFNNGTLFAVECKTDLESLLAEDRYRVQIPLYEIELQKIIKEYAAKEKQMINAQVFLLIGGRETDLLPPGHPQNTAKVGQKSEKFYRTIMEKRIRFVSADSLWAATVYSLVKEKRLCMDALLSHLLEDPNFIGLCSAGKILRTASGMALVKIEKKVIESFEQPFF